MMKKPPFLTAASDIPGDRRITLEHLRVFAAVAHTKSFRAAGCRLGRTQSAITQSIKNLEEYLCCRLLERRQGSVLGLTENGEKLLPGAIDIIQKTDLLVLSLRRPKLKEHIHFGIPLSIGTADLQKVLSSYLTANKGLRVRLISDSSMRLDAMLENGDLDAAIINEGTASLIEGNLAVEQTLLDEPLVWVSHPDVQINWTEDLPFIAFSGGSPWTQAAVRALHEAGIPHYYAYTSPSFESVCSAVGEGMGITVLPVGKVPGKCASVADNSRLPPLPKVRTVMRVKNRSKCVLDFCELVARLPIFSQPG